MSDKRIRLVLYKSDLHKAVVHEGIEESIIDSILNFHLHEYPIEEKGKINLLDLDTKERINQFDYVENVNLFDNLIEELCYYGIFPNNLAPIEIPVSTTSLYIKTSDGLTLLWYNDIILNNLWIKIRNETEIYNFLKEPSVVERDCFEGKLRSLYNELGKLKVESQINKLIIKILDSNINELEISHVHLTNDDFTELSKLNKLRELRLQYNFTDNFISFPVNLTRLKIYGSTIQKISQINFKNLKIIDLSLEGNCINNLCGLEKLPNSINYINLKSNRIRNFDIQKLPNNLETLWLCGNLIDNSFFEGVNKNVVNSSIKHLSISHNLLKINNWLLRRVVDIFPNLEHLELGGNHTEGITDSILLNDDEYSSIESIKFYLANEEYKNDGHFNDYESTFNYYKNTNDINIKWTHESLPVKEIMAGIDYLFSDYLREMPEFIRFTDGLYCNFPHHETSMLIRGYSIKEKRIEFNLFASNSITFEKYFYKYFIEINRIINLNIHHYILPSANFPESCNEFKLFYEKVFKLNEVLNEIPVFILDGGIPQILVRKVKKSELKNLADNSNDSILLKKRNYKDIRKVAFVITTDRNIYPYTIDDDFLISNNECGNEAYLNEYYVVPVDSSRKNSYVDSLRNIYLGSNCFQEGILYTGINKNGKITIYINPTHFKVVNEDIICIESKTRINHQNLGQFSKDNKTFRLEILDCKLSGHYISAK